MKFLNLHSVFQHIHVRGWLVTLMYLNLFTLSMYLIKSQHRMLWLRQFAGPHLSGTKRIVTFSIIAMSFFDRCCSYSLNNSSKSVKYKLHWLFISFWSACVTPLPHDHCRPPSAILLSDKFSSPQTLSVETGQLGPNLLTWILSCWHEFWVVDLDRFQVIENWIWESVYPAAKKLFLSWFFCRWF